MLDLVVHAAHATHTAATGRHTGAALVFLRYFGHHGFGGDQESRNRGCILDRHANDLGRVDNARRDQVDIFAGLRVEAVVVLILLEDLADDDDTFLDSRAGRMHRVIHAILALLDLDFGRAADPDHRDAAREFRQTLLQLLAVVVRGGLLDLRLDLGHAGLDVGLLAGAVDDGGVFLVDHHLLGAAEHGERDVLELDAEIFRDRLAAGQDRDVLQHGLAAIAEARRLDGRDLQAATETVHH